MVTLGREDVMKVVSGENRETVVERSCERSSKEENVELFQLGRMNFKKEYKPLKNIFPDIDKISKIAHFRVVWKRHITPDTPTKSPDPTEHHHPHEQQQQQQQPSQHTESKPASQHTYNQPASQRKEEMEQFFSVPEGVPLEAMNGRVMLEKEKRGLWVRKGGKWMKIEEEWIELINGDEVAVCLNKDLEADMYFKINYRFK